MEPLTQAEELVMRILWDIKEGVVHDIIAKMPDPKPPYTTVSSTVRALEKKGFIAHKAFGRTYLYFPSISREQYGKHSFKDIVGYYFNGSAKNVLSFLVGEKDLKENEIDDLRAMISELTQNKPKK